MKKLLTILALIMLIISLFQITSMYALYKERLEGDYSTLLGAWEIRVNTKDITSSGQTEVFTISDSQLGYVASEYIQAGKIAPNGQAYFDIVIDPSNVYTDLTKQTEYTVYSDVSIIYTINLGSDTDETAPANIELVSVENYFQKDGETAQTANDENFKNGNLYTSVIPVDKITQGYKNYIRLYFKWVNVEANNETDSTLAQTQVETEVDGEVQVEGGKISVPVQINLKQYTGEEYKGEVTGNES